MKNFFTLFSMPQNFTIDLSDLEKKYIMFQNQFHPDKAGIAEIEKSIEINEGYKILSDDFLRACHLLQLQEIDILNDEKAVKVNQETLLEILELQEKISEISDKSKIDALQKEINSCKNTLILDAIKALQVNEIETCAQILIRAKYLKKSLEDLKIRKQKI